ncbi:MAG TPA: carboxypeptidase-like regulatory domain-containing protein, partial [Bryobacteraceae bacterium]|nr:carboxypeptidase-like regulatory domain-containing protein [Bryobacteraceae bacterium]
LDHPRRHCRVRVTLEQAGKPVYSATSDAQGRFRMTGVANGVYAARYSAPGYFSEDDQGPPRSFQVRAAIRFRSKPA